MADDRKSGDRKGGHVETIMEDIGSDSPTVPRYIEYDEPPLKLSELLRYSGLPADRALAIASGKLTEPEIIAKVNKVVLISRGTLVCKTGYMVSPLGWDAEGFPVLPLEQHSETLKKNLKGCSRAVLFAATIGAGFDRLIRRYERTEMDTALFLQGYGAERAESLANTFNNEVKEAAELLGYKAHPRFSPGFGDLQLAVQKEFLGLLDAGRRMGITLSESCLMAPSKSVTAIIGLERK